jgi:hypothetical protein
MFLTLLVLTSSEDNVACYVTTSMPWLTFPDNPRSLL